MFKNTTPMIRKTNKPALKTIGIIPITAPGGAMCYQAIVNRSIALYGGHHHPTICMHHHNFEEYHHAQSAGNWERVAELLLDSAERVYKAGAEFGIIPANTMHRKEILEQLKQSPLPILSMLDVVAEYCHKNNYSTIAILGTKWTMQDNIYKEALEKYGIKSLIPNKEEQAFLQTVIIDELIPGKQTKNTERNLLNLVEAIKHRHPAVTLGLACTELPIVLNQANCGMPVVDTTTVQAHAAVAMAAQLNFEQMARAIPFL